MQHVLITQGGQFSNHHFLSDKVPDEIHLYLGWVRVLGTPEGTWLIYKRDSAQELDNPKQLYYYDTAFMHHPKMTPEHDGDLVRYY